MGNFRPHRPYIRIYLTSGINRGPLFGITMNGVDLALHVASTEGKHRGPRHALRMGNDEAIIIVPRKFSVAWSN